MLTDVTLDGYPDKSLRIYTILDEQSNATLLGKHVLEYFGASFPAVHFDITTADASNISRFKGSLVSGLNVTGVLTDNSIPLHDVLTIDNLSDSRSQVATPEMAALHEHVIPFVDKFPPFDPAARVSLLIGTNNPRALETNVPLPRQHPLIHDTSLGYALVGPVSVPLAQSDRPFPLDTHHNTVPPILTVSNIAVHTDTLHSCTDSAALTPVPEGNVFEQRPDDDTIGTSHENKLFIDLMDEQVDILPGGNIELPLPLRPNFELPDNKSAIYMRSKNTIASIKRDPTKTDKCRAAMQKNLDHNFVEEIPPNERSSDTKKCFYIPVFPVVQSKPFKEDKIRLVYDASAKHKGVSLNDALFQGPDLTNSLRGVLLRFRERPVAFSADVESMFNNFRVPSQHCDMLRFFWPHKNDFNNELSEYRALTHVFGCTSSPSVAAYGLKYAVRDIPEFTDMTTVKKYVEESFYVDDGICCTDTVDEAIALLKGAVNVLKKRNIRLHKIMSNEPDVLKAFPPEECSVSVASLELQKSELQTTLGVAWSLDTDCLTMNVNIPEKKFTKRGILSVISSLYDPINFVTPIVLGGRLLQPKFIPQKEANSPLYHLDWDDELPSEHLPEWQAWLQSLQSLHNLSVARCLVPKNFPVSVQELHVFADASEEAIAHVIYLRSTATDGRVHVSFVSSAAQVAPRAATSMPRLELCAALEAARSASDIVSALERKPTSVHYYSDSKVVLGYLFNETRAYRKYVERRVNELRRCAPASQWHYVGTLDNPADLATRPLSPNALFESNWIDGPPFLWEPSFVPEPYVNRKSPEPLPEEVMQIQTMITHAGNKVHPFFEKGRTFNQLITLFMALLRFKHNVIRRRQQVNGVPAAQMEPWPNRECAVRLLVRAAQSDAYACVRDTLAHGKQVPEHHPVSTLAPRLDQDQLMRVGGRLHHAKMPLAHKHPYLIPKGHPVATAIVNHFHSLTYHQGRHITHGAIIKHGYFLEGSRRLIQSALKNCVTCRKLRGPLATQQMADLPPDRLACTPPFTHTALDVFGPFTATNGPRTRANKSTKKLWAIIFVCLPSRAIHLEPLDSLSTDSFRMALTRFISIRGVCKTIRSDRGTNFVGASNQMNNVDVKKLSHELQNNNITWTFNPPHASHFGGSWEAKIGAVRKVMNGIFCMSPCTRMSREEFDTVLAQAAAVVNDTPLWACPTSPDDPAPLTPSMLITGRETSDPISADEINLDAITSYGPARRKRVIHLNNLFWQRWRTEYLQTLNKRHKWKRPQRCFSVNDIVLIRDKQAPRGDWPMARVVAAKPGRDGLVREVDLRLTPLRDKKGPRFKSRPIHELVLLVPADDVDNPSTLSRPR